MVPEVGVSAFEVLMGTEVLSPGLSEKKDLSGGEKGLGAKETA